MGVACCHERRAEATSEVVEKIPQSQPALGRSLLGREKERESEKEANLVVITVVGARGLRDSDWLPGTGKPDCYCEVMAGGRRLHTTATVESTCEPVFDEAFWVADLEEDSPLEFRVYDKDLAGRDFLGKALLPAKDYAAEGFNGELKLLDTKADQAYIRVKAKVAGRDLPPGPSAEVTITIQRSSKETPMGFRLDTRDSSLLQVTGITEEGPVGAYNAGAKLQEQVKVHDFIASVNGATGTKAMLEEINRNLKVECLIKRCVFPTVIFDRGEASAPVGLQFVEHGNADFLVIKGMDASRQSATAKDHERLRLGDRIVSVGSTKGKASVLERRLKEHTGKVQLVVMRPASGPGAEGGAARLVHWLFG